MINKTLFKSQLFRNFLTLLSGTTLAQGIVLLVTPLLTRIYSPDDFGGWSLFIAVSTIVSVVATARYELSIILPKENKDALNLLAVSVLIAMTFSLFLFIPVIFLHAPISKWLNIKHGSGWLYLVPVTVFFMGCYQAFNYWSTRQKTFKRNAASRITMTTGTTAAQLSTGVVQSGSYGLIFGTFIGYIAGTLVLSWKTIKRIKSYLPQLSIKEMKKNMKQYKSFVWINSPHALLDSFVNYGIFFIITYYFTDIILGLYGFTFRILRAPVGLIGSAMAQVYYQKASEANNAGQNTGIMLLRIYKNLFVIGFPIFAIFFFISPWLFSEIFGSRWYEAGVIARIISPWLFLNFIASSVSHTPLIFNKQKGAFYICLVDLLIRVSALIIGGWYHNYKLAFTLMSIGCSLLMVFILYWYYKISKESKAGYAIFEYKTS